MDGQISLFDDETKTQELSEPSLTVVKVTFRESTNLSWQELFDGYDELYGITFSSGIKFMEKVFDSFDRVDMIFGCEGILNSDLATIISAQIKSVEHLVKSKSAKRIAERMAEGNIDISVSRDVLSHEKIYVLKAYDGRVRVICGSANMSASAFLGIQRENIVVFDDQAAYDYYKNLFDTFKEKCSDSVSERLYVKLFEDPDEIQNNIEDTPIINTVKTEGIVILEPSTDSEEVDIVADIKGLEKEIKPLAPKIKPEGGKLILTENAVTALKRKYDEHIEVKKARQRKLPKLCVDYDNKRLLFNEKECILNPEQDKVKDDLLCVLNYIDSLSSFYGNYEQTQRDYYKFMNWYLCSPFMPYLRYMGDKTGYPYVDCFPVFGILYGKSNGGKTTFVKLLSKLMTGVRIPPCSSQDFTSKNIERLKASCEGVPLNIDDVAKAQYDTHYDKIIKDDGFGLREHFVNYPSVVITSNKIAALKPDIAKRVVAFRIDIRIDREAGVSSSKRINDSLKNVSNSFFCEYTRRMFEVIDKMVAKMKEGDEQYSPDIFEESSRVILSIFKYLKMEQPNFVTALTLSDYTGNKVFGKHAINKILTAWETEPKAFKVDKKKNALIYTYPEGGQYYELTYLQDELPPELEAHKSSRSLVMKLDEAQKLFGISFKRPFIKR